MVVDVAQRPVNAGSKRDSSGTVTRHFVAPSGPEFDVAAMGIAVDLTDAPDSDDDMDSLEAAEAEALEGITTQPPPNTAPGIDDAPDMYGRIETQFQPLESYPTLPFDAQQTYPLTGSPVFLGTELEHPDDPLKPGLGTSNFIPSYEQPDERIKTDFANVHRSTVAPGLAALLPPSLQAPAQQPFSDNKMLTFDRFREQLHKAQVALATLITIKSSSSPGMGYPWKRGLDTPQG